MNIVRSRIKNILLNLVYPPRCVFCQNRLSPKIRINVCSDCANTLPYTRVYNRCKRCGKPLHENKSGICRHCSTVKIHSTQITSAFVYIDPAKQAAVRFKKERYLGYAKTFAVYITEMVKYDFKNVAFDFVVSVPPRKKAFTEEHYDQAQALARAVALRLGIPYLPNALAQSGRLRKQSTLSYNDRIKNVKDKFVVKKADAVKNKTILLIDDICTSGATINECSKMLKAAGAYRVYAATFATVPAI